MYKETLRNGMNMVLLWCYKETLWCHYNVTMVLLWGYCGVTIMLVENVEEFAALLVIGDAAKR